MRESYSSTNFPLSIFETPAPYLHLKPTLMVKYILYAIFLLCACRPQVELPKITESISIEIDPEDQVFRLTDIWHPSGTDLSSCEPVLTASYRMELKCFGAEISYNRWRESYVYEEPFELDFNNP